MTKDYPRIVTPPPGPKGKAIVERDRSSTATCYLKEYPLVVARGQGAMIEDVDGNRYLDFMAGIAVASTGHAHPKVVAAIQDAASKFLHICGGDFYYEAFAALPEKLARIAPGKEPKKVFLTNSGTEAIEGALKLARHSTRRAAFIAFEGSFHGRTYGSLSLTNSKVTQRAGFGPFLPEVYHAPYGDAEFIEQRLFTRRLDPRDVAAIIVEPIQGEGGYIVPPKGFLSKLRAICDEHGIVLIMDEVQSGIGRTGKWWAVEHTGVEPDMVCMAKGVASGMPLGITMTRAEIMDWVPGSHASTFGGNPVAIAAALATLDVIEKENLLENSASVGNHIVKRMADWPSKLKLVGDVRGRGLMIGVEIVKDKLTKEYGAAERDRIVELAFERGVLFLGCGPSTIRLCPPLIVTKEEADVAVDVLEECIRAVGKSA